MEVYGDVYLDGASQVYEEVYLGEEAAVAVPSRRFAIIGGDVRSKTIYGG